VKEHHKHNAGESLRSNLKGAYRLCNIIQCSSLWCNLPITAATCGRSWQKAYINQWLNYNQPTRRTVHIMQRVSKSKRQASRANISCFRTSQSTTRIAGFNAAHSPQTSLPDSSSYHPASVDAPKLGSCDTCSPHFHPNHRSLLVAQEHSP
jgi:hypothetical protein